MGTLHEDICTFMMTSHSVLLRMRDVSDKSCRENQNTHLMLNNFFFFESHAVYEILWKNIVELDRPQIIIWCMRIAYLITKATNTHSEHVILTVFSRQQWLHEHASVFCYTYIACLVTAPVLGLHN
jgi:hypothetical protein